MANSLESNVQSKGDFYISKNELGGKTEEIKDFCRKNNFSADELSKAYQIALGVDSVDPDSKLSKLVDLLKVNFKNGYPLNRIAELVDQMTSVENSRKDNEEKKKVFFAQLEEFGLSEKEQKLLLAIANQRKMGEVSFYKGVGGDEIMRLSIKGIVAPADQFSERIASEIIEILRKVKEEVGNGKISIILDV